MFLEVIGSTFLIILSALVSNSLSSTPITHEVIMLSELFRHGARTPTSPPIMPGFEFIHEIGLGQLTPNGMRQHQMGG